MHLRNVFVHYLGKGLFQRLLERWRTAGFIVSLKSIYGDLLELHLVANLVEALVSKHKHGSGDVSSPKLRHQNGLYGISAVQRLSIRTKIRLLENVVDWNCPVSIQLNVWNRHLL